MREEVSSLFGLNWVEKEEVMKHLKSWGLKEKEKLGSVIGVVRIL